MKSQRLDARIGLLTRDRHCSESDAPSGWHSMIGMAPIVTLMVGCRRVRLTSYWLHATGTWPVVELRMKGGTGGSQGER